LTAAEPKQGIPNKAFSLPARNILLQIRVFLHCIGLLRAGAFHAPICCRSQIAVFDTCGHSTMVKFFQDISIKKVTHIFTIHSGSAT